MADVFAVLADIASYPVWWPEVRTVHTNDGEGHELRCRSLLPYNLRFSMAPSLIDSMNGILQANLAGDLVGFSRWTLTTTGTQTTAQFDEDVATNKPLLNLLAPVARAAFTFNHQLMMKHGETGLRKHLESSHFS